MKCALFCVLSSLALVVSSIQDLVAQDMNADDLAFFEQKVRPLLIDKCYECHSTQSKQTQGGLRLDSRDSILAGGDNGPAIVAGKPDQSLLVRAVHYVEPKIEMPPSGKLNVRSIEILEEWIRRGVPFPSSKVEPRHKIQIDLEAGKSHWAFRPFSTSKAPNDGPSNWASNPIDCFVASRWLGRNLQPLERAPIAQLLRRAKFDLLGLPLSTDELEEFLRDNSPDAFDRKIQEWLASPNYGERWARPWLELVRYCDISESWAETIGNSYLYRDWVIQALNEDMPFDRFTQLQLAADQIPDARPTDIAALGFLGLSPSYWKELQLPVEIIKSIVSDEYEERIHTFSSTFLGLNLACARCHDHKFDPFTSEDYYAIAGVFASTRIADRSLRPDVDSLQVYRAHQNVRKLDLELQKVLGEIKKLQAKPETTGSADLASKLVQKEGERDELQRKIEAEKKTEGFNFPMAPAAIDATLVVKEASGTHGSQIVYDNRPIDAAVEIRGDPNKRGPIVPRRYISVLSKAEPAHFTNGSGRVDLGRALFAESETLVARVIVNRIWKLHFGTGIVDTPSDFGRLGMPPSHPELLDDLAQRFIQNGWSLKWLHRQILNSATYQQMSAGENREDTAMFHGFPIRRLDIEAWRDSILIASDSLNRQMYGPPSELLIESNRRRTIYGTIKRRELNDLLRLHDFPDPLTHSPNRIPTTTPLQQLFAMNSPFILEQSRLIAERLEREVGADSNSRILAAYRILFQRQPSVRELSIGLEYVGTQAAQESWQQYMHALITSNEFLFVD